MNREEYLKELELEIDQLHKDIREADSASLRSDLKVRLKAREEAYEMNQWLKESGFNGGEHGV